LQFEKAAISHDDKAVNTNLLLTQGWEKKPSIVSIERGGPENDFYELLLNITHSQKIKKINFSQPWKE
jgi:hypothetical protein